jgi:hypothetical protein
MAESISRKLFPLVAALLALASPLAAGTEVDSIPRGVWRSHGNAEILVISADSFTIYDVTAVTCIQRQEGPIGELAGTGGVYPELEPIGSERLIASGNYYRYELRRVPELPEMCREQPVPDPFLIFDAFWHYLDENYAFFELRGIDWDNMRRQYRPRVAAEMSEGEIFALLGEMVGRINDPHVFITNGKQGEENISFGSEDVHGVAQAIQRGLPGREEREYRAAARAAESGIEQVIKVELLDWKFQTAHNDKLLWGWLTPEIAYLRSPFFAGMFPGLGREEMYARLEETLDAIFAEFGKARGLVIDLAINPGGAEFIPMAIGSRLVNRPGVAFTKRETTPSGLSEPLEVRLEPRGRHRFTGPVALLISGNTVSGGEVLPLALITEPNITLVGEPTAGALSDILMKSLPGGGTVGFSYQVVLAADGESYEMRGVPPDVEVQVFDPETPISSYGKAIESAIQVLREQIGAIPAEQATDDVSGRQDREAFAP